MSEGLTRNKTALPGAIVPSSSPGADNDVLREYLAFQLAEEFYALPLGSIREILKPGMYYMDASGSWKQK